MKVFSIGVTFRAAGDMFEHGLAHAAQELGIEYDCAICDDARLTEKIEAFTPDLLLVIHGRELMLKWKNKIPRVPHSAIWLVDEPYETDDTQRYSKYFDSVFLNDTSTLNLHHNAHYLPTCYDPSRHFDPDIERNYRCGFVGTNSGTRRDYLRTLARADLIDYVIGGPFTTPTILARLSRGVHAEPAQVAEYYQKTKVIMNFWREKHHFNERRIPGRSMSPRIYEALACGAIVLSEWRPEITEVFPDLPLFAREDEMLYTLRQLLSDDDMRESLLRNCRKELSGHTYADRLAEVLKVCLGWEPEAKR